MNAEEIKSYKESDSFIHDCINDPTKTDMTAAEAWLLLNPETTAEYLRPYEDEDKALEAVTHACVIGCYALNKIIAKDRIEENGKTKCPVCGATLYKKSMYCHMCGQALKNIN